jgi:hypothetical protein
LSAEENPLNLEKFLKKSDNPVELGHVNWLRNFEEAKVQAVKENKPILVFFQEVPGCSTASGYGKRVMTHPLIIEAIESLFVPVAIYNNIGGHDREILNSFNEPSWNNPVVRIISPDGKLLSPRLNGDYTRLGLVNSMVTALKNNNAEVPQYLEILQKELSANNSPTDKAVFSMYCFWSGEAGLGNIDGIVSTEPGFMGGREVVQVEFNPSVISYKDLVNTAKRKNVSKKVFVKNSTERITAEKLLGGSSVLDAGSFRSDNEPKYYMSKTVYRYVPMLQLQASLVNSAIGSRSSPDIYLSPRQLIILSYVKKNPNLGWIYTIGRDEITTTRNDTLRIAKSS